MARRRTHWIFSDDNPHRDMTMEEAYAWAESTPLPEPRAPEQTAPPPEQPRASVDRRQDMDYQLAAVTRWTGEPFALGLFAGMLATPGGVRHERPTFEALDIARRAKENGWCSLGGVQSLGYVAGLAVDRALGLAFFWLKHFARPVSFLWAFTVAWFLGMPKIEAAKRYAVWSAVTSLVVCLDAPKSLRVLAVAYEAYYLVGDYLAGPVSLMTFWLSTFMVLEVVCVLVNTVFPPVAEGQSLPFSEALARWLTTKPRFVRRGVWFFHNSFVVMLIATPLNSSMVALGAAFAPSWVLSRYHPHLGRLAHLVCRLSELTKASLFERAGVAVWSHPMHVSDNLWETPIAAMDREAMWRRYRKAIRLEGKKEQFRRRRRELDGLMGQGLLEEVPAEVGDLVLEYLGFPAGARAPGDDRDEREYMYFKRSQNHPSWMDPGWPKGLVAVTIFLSLAGATFNWARP